MPKIGQLKGATEVHLLVFEDENRKKIFQMIVHGGQFGSKLEEKSSELVRKLRAPMY